MNLLLSTHQATPLTEDQPRRPWFPGLSTGLVVLSLVPVIAWYLRRLNDGSDEPLGLIALALALLLAWRDRHCLHITKRSRNIGSVLLLASALATPALPPLLRATMAVGGLACFYGIHRRIGLVTLLVLSLPVVASLQFYCGYPMRVASAEGVVRILRWFGAVAGRDGTGIFFEGLAHNVDPACSGIRMLWHSLVAASALGALHRLSARRTLLLVGLAAVLTIPANTLRALLLVLEATGKCPKFLSHEGTGLLCTALMLGILWWLAAKHGKPASAIVCHAPVRMRHLVLLMVAAIAGPWFTLASPRRFYPSSPISAVTQFTFDGLTLPLQPFEATDMEQSFAQGFPGTLGSYRWHDRQVVLRQVTTATRQLHPSRDCLLAAGFTTTDAVVEIRNGSERWSRFIASRAGQRLIVHERIVSEADGKAWTDVSAWYWSALFHPLNGPWRAETVIEEN